jgi:methylenetetrahydrofolate reductase (NADPH)
LEFFPPKTLAASFQVWESLKTLVPLSPDFVSITYGADGGSRHLTQEMMETMNHYYAFDIAPHLTCTKMSKKETLDIACRYWDLGVRQIVALRGDPPKHNSKFCPHPNGFSSSIELVEELANTGFRNIRVGAYPELHPESLSINSNIDWLKQKFDAGATSAITQFFFDSKTFLRFRDKCVRAGIKAPIIPGILPIENWDKNKIFITRCGAHVPDNLIAKFTSAKHDNVEDIVSVNITTDICKDLIKEGVDQLHFYTLNRPTLTYEVCIALGVIPSISQRRQA